MSAPCACTPGPFPFHQPQRCLAACKLLCWDPGLLATPFFPPSPPIWKKGLTLWIPSFGNNSTHFLKGWSLASRAVWWRHLSCLPAEGSRSLCRMGQVVPGSCPSHPGVLAWLPRDQAQELGHLRSPKLFANPTPDAQDFPSHRSLLPHPWFPTCWRARGGGGGQGGCSGPWSPHCSMALPPFPFETFPLTSHHPPAPP